MPDVHPSGRVREAAIEPDRPIVDAHHHLWPTAPVPEMMAWGAEDLYRYKAESGHTIVKTVFVEAHASYRTDGPAHLAPVGETDYAAGVGAEADRRGGALAGGVAAIIPSADLMLGARVEAVLAAHASASDRLRGIRYAVAYDEDMPYDMGTRPGMMAAPAFRAGFARLASLGLSFDVWAMQSQLGEVAALAAAFPATTLVIDHVGVPLGIGRFAADPAASFAAWRDGLRRAAMQPNVVLKLGGLNMAITGLGPPADAPAPWSSSRVAETQRRHILTAIDVFGPERCMFESNFPVDRVACDGATLWNSFKRMVSDFGDAEKTALFRGTAERVYRI